MTYTAAIHATTRYNLEIDEDGETFPIPFEVDPDTVTVTLSEDGLTAYIGAMVHDEDASDPIEEFDNGGLVVFDRSKKHDGDRPEIDEFKRLIRQHPGLIVTIHLHEYGGSLYKVAAGPLTVADTKRVKSPQFYNCDQTGKHDPTPHAEIALADASGYYIIPEDATDPAKYAAAQMEAYTNWANGEVYGTWCWRYTRPDTGSPWQLDESSRDSECWGFIGSDYAASERDDRVAEAIAADAL